MDELRYEIVDVFSDRPYAGNPLAVVYSAESLTSSQMQIIATEFNLSETTFVLPPSDVKMADYRIRIFTTTAELPFAGHPSIGTAWSLARNSVIASGDRVQECGAGLLPVYVDSRGARVAGGAASVGSVAHGEELALAVGLRPDDIDDRAPAGWASAGHPYLFLMVQPDAVARALPDSAAIERLTRGPYGVVVCSISPDATDVHARMFAPGSGTPEDPATGSAAVALGVYMADRGLIPADGSHRFTVIQGVEMGRRSVLHSTVECRDGAAIATSVAGDVVAVSSGVIHAVP